MLQIYRWGNTPLDEGRISGNKMLIKLLEEARSAQLSELPEGSQEITGFYYLFNLHLFLLHY